MFLQTQMTGKILWKSWLHNMAHREMTRKNKTRSPQLFNRHVGLFAYTSHCKCFYGWKKYVNVYAYISRDHRRWPTNSYRQEETTHRWITPLILHIGLDQWCTPLTARQGGAGKPIKALPSRHTVGVWLRALSLLGSWRSKDILGCVSPGQEPFDCDLLSIHQDNTDTLKSCMYQKCSPKKVVLATAYGLFGWQTMAPGILTPSSLQLIQTTYILPGLWRWCSLLGSRPWNSHQAPSGCEQSGHPSVCNCSLWFPAGHSSHQCTPHCSALDKMLGCTAGWLPQIRGRSALSPPSIPLPELQGHLSSTHICQEPSIFHF